MAYQSRPAAAAQTRSRRPDPRSGEPAGPRPDRPPPPPGRAATPDALPELEALGMFVAVVDAGGFTAAARRLGVRKARLSRRVAELEARLGVRLLHRTTRVVRLTDDGSAYHEHAVRALAAARDAETALARRADQIAGRVRVAATPALAELVMAPVIAPFLARHPRVELEFDVGPRVVDLVAEGFDLALRGGALADASHRARRVGTARIGYYASPAYVARRGAPERPADLEHHDVLAVADREPITWHFVENGRALARPLRPRLVATNELVLLAARAGAGILRLPSFAAAPLVAAGELMPVLAPWTPGPGPIHLVMPPGRPSAPARLLVDQLVRALTADPPLVG